MKLPKEAYRIDVQATIFPCLAEKEAELPKEERRCLGIAEFDRKVPGRFSISHRLNPQFCCLLEIAERRLDETRAFEIPIRLMLSLEEDVSQEVQRYLSRLLADLFEGVEIAIQRQLAENLGLLVSFVFDATPVLVVTEGPKTRAATWKGDGFWTNQVHALPMQPDAIDPQWHHVVMGELLELVTSEG